MRVAEIELSNEVKQSASHGALSLRTKIYAMSAIDRAQQEAVFDVNAAVRARHSDNPRQSYAAICALTPIAEGVELTPVAEPHLSGWWVTPASADQAQPILFIHGGGYHFGDAQSYRGLLSQIAIRTGCPVLGIDYPLAPEAPFPAAFEAAVKARDWLVQRDLDTFALIGDSAGGGLALALLSAKPSAATPASVVVFSPWTDLTLSGASFSDPETSDPIFKPDLLTGLACTYLDGADPTDGRVSPLYEIPADAPPILLQVGTNELLLDDAKRYAEAAARLGVEVELQLFDGMHHVFQRDAGRLAMAGFALDEAARFIKAHR